MFHPKFYKRRYTKAKNIFVLPNVHQMVLLNEIGRSILFGSKRFYLGDISFKDDLFPEYLVVDDRKGLLINENVWRVFKINSIFRPG